MRTNGTILLVDDEKYVRDSLAAVLRRRTYDVRCAADVEDALGQHELDGIDVVVTDLKMPGADGLELLRRFATAAPELPVIVLTGHGTVASAVECMQAGAAEYLLKPVDPDALLLVIRRILREVGTRRELAYLRRGGDDAPRERLLGVSKSWQCVLEEAKVAAGSDAPVLIQGESGTGKEEVAQFIHRSSARRDGPIVGVNCAAIPLELFESEFFGHRRGAFTGAVEERVGRWKVADRGTLFLDEINSLPAVAQPKVLRALQEGTFERVGDSRPTSADVRVICASNVPLEDAVEGGAFRRDLFYRINVLTLRIPPLRERPEDVAILAEAFLRELAARNGKAIGAFEDGALDAMGRYAWAGNVRELRNVIERALVVERGARISEHSLRLDAGAAAAPEPGPEPAALPPGIVPLEEMERELVRRAMQAAGDNQTRAAELLDITRDQLRYRLKKFDMRHDD
ncbi:MAG: sigma-54 dependent transcriptional regulator [Thermoanaerobaculia bacterium]|nr:sigma-54 dependent transcriptional regulator [Thermoanaerobaculia bacterium]